MEDVRALSESSKAAGKPDGKGCPGMITASREGAFIDCSACSGKGRLDDPRCFMGIAGKLHPGFSGEITIRKVSDVSYRGPVVEALVSSSEILDLFEGMKDLAIGMKRIPFGKNHSEKIVSLIKEVFTADPAGFLAESKKNRKVLANAANEGSGKILSIFDDTVERTSLMLRKMERASEKN